MSGATAERAALEALAAELCEGLAQRDLERVLACYDEEVVLMVPGAPLVRGSVALRAYYEGVIAAGVSAAEMRLSQVESLGGAVAEVGEYSMRLEPPQGEPFEDSGKYLVVCRRDGEGKLRFWLDMFHSDAGAGG